jgi:hypothetical protein
MLDKLHPRWRPGQFEHGSNDLFVTGEIWNQVVTLMASRTF